MVDDLGFWVPPTPIPSPRGGGETPCIDGSSQPTGRPSDPSVTAPPPLPLVGRGWGWGDLRQSPRPERTQ